MVFEVEGEKRLYLVEEYYWDGTIIDYLKYPIYNQLEEARLPEARRRKIFGDLLEGLIAIHKAGIIHHDIKPDNILLDLKREEGEAVIADFQQATYTRSEEEIRYRGMLPQWAPPEFARVHLLPGLSDEQRFGSRRRSSPTGSTSGASGSSSTAWPSTSSPSGYRSTGAREGYNGGGVSDHRGGAKERVAP